MNTRLIFLSTSMLAIFSLFNHNFNQSIESAIAAQSSGTKVKIIEASFEEDFYRSIKSVIRNKNKISADAKIGVYLPKGLKANKSIPLFFAMRPGTGSGLSAINTYKRYADELGFAVAAIGLNSGSDNEDSRLYYMLNCVKLLTDKGLLDDEPVLLGGFSGGGKWALHLGAWGGDYFSGVLAAGTNEDLATFGYRQTLNKTCFNLPIVMLNGTTDNIAGIADYNYYPMFWRMKETGFKKVKAMVYEGAHSLPYQETLDAFEYLLDNAGVRKKII